MEHLFCMVLDVENGVITTNLKGFRRKAKYDIYMETMIKALARVSSQYISRDASYHLERTFMCEFYHQWSMFLQMENPQRLYLNGEVCKHLNDNNNEKCKYPDLILHHSQDDNQDNRIACELKRQNWEDEDFVKDMNTLKLALTSASYNAKLKENFKWGVLIQIGGDIDKIEEFVKNKRYHNKIWCIVVNDDVSQITIKTIGEMR